MRHIYYLQMHICMSDVSIVLWFIFKPDQTGPRRLIKKQSKNKNQNGLSDYSAVTIFSSVLEMELCILGARVHAIITISKSYYGIKARLF